MRCVETGRIGRYADPPDSLAASSAVLEERRGKTVGALDVAIGPAERRRAHATMAAPSGCLMPHAPGLPFWKYLCIESDSIDRLKRSERTHIVAMPPEKAKPPPLLLPLPLLAGAGARGCC